jgi:hypothetical protein
MRREKECSHPELLKTKEREALLDRSIQTLPRLISNPPEQIPSIADLQEGTKKSGDM